MGKGIEGSKFKECINKGKIRKSSSAVNLVSKELNSADQDLKTAKESFKLKNYKWTTIQAYYSMFHVSRALIYSKGYRERSHYCLIVVLNALFVDEGLLESRLVDAVQTGKTLRENADYENEFSKNSAQALLDKSQELFKKAQSLLE